MSSPDKYVQNAAYGQPGHVYDKKDLEGIHKAYETDGFVVFHVLSQQQCDDLVFEQWRRVIATQPWKDGVRIVLRDEKGGVLDPENPEHKTEILAHITGAFMTADQRRDFEAGWPLHRGFGATCDPAVWNLDGVWKVREDPELYEIACKLLGRWRMHVSIDRSINKLPKQGDEALLHWDEDIYVRWLENLMGLPRTAVLQGKVQYSRSKFVCVPGSHTDAFLETFVDTYQADYPNMFTPHSKFGLQKHKPDPLKLFSKKCVFNLPGGTMCFWNAALMHGHSKSGATDPIAWGHYQAYQAGAPTAEAHEDRIASYRNGTIPKRFFSRDKIKFYPAKFDNYPRLLDAYLDKLPEDHPMRGTRKNSRNEDVPTLVPQAQANYVPPNLSLLGKRLLGLEPWERSKRVRAEP
jgi:hypothetical protein